jgi:hypothetical protein
MLSVEMTPSVLREHAAKLVKAYPRDLDLSLEEELVQFKSVINTDLFQIDNSMELSMYRKITENDLQTCFPKVEAALRIYLCLMVSNCTGERSFMKLKLVIRAICEALWVKAG